MKSCRSMPSAGSRYRGHQFRQADQNELVAYLFLKESFTQRTAKVSSLAGILLDLQLLILARRTVERGAAALNDAFDRAGAAASHAGLAFAVVDGEGFL